MPSLRTPHSFQSSHSWTQAVSGAERLVHPKGGSVINPRELLGQDLTVITEHIRRLLGSGHPVLNTISAYYFQQQGKHIRPLIVLLMSMAANVTAQTQSAAKGVVPASREDIDRAIGDSEIVFRDFMKDSSAVSPSYPSSDLPILDSQRRLAEITEMIHTASLLHDDVIDESPTRRNNPSAHAAFGNKMAILAGDFLLARASVALARLRNVEVVELLATVISNLVEGEFMQLRNSQAADADVKPSVAARVAALMVGGSSESEPSVKMTKFEYYLEKTYLKTASLIAKSCRAAAVLGGGAEEVTQIAYDYGKNLGLAFQIVDDMLDFVSTAEELGKPAAADLNLGLATAPVLYAAEEYPEMNELIERKFNQPGDVEQALDLVRRSDGVKATMDLAVSYCQRAIDEIAKLPESPARNALIDLTYTVVNRKK
ncbi:terpenoid synthase [Gonapodya prolifera JEL478]|uniref:Terpenoid synthase n=1 Tax=Gonapodya prolifera (strain JEL478) TaxID=1344416 RepID=A0A139AUB9_GONPJ|nr:terpenoid synthase [Gonapodya prolifera JEL478]|eukprot:KXS20163.1 terpenoid synthase [Gonapodya prolifera JEL478]